MTLLRLLLLGLFLAASASPRLAAAEESDAPASSEEEEEAPKPKPKKKAKKKKGYDYEQSKYKAFRVDGAEPGSYKFNSDGKPIGDKKKGKKAKKKLVSVPEDEIDGVVPLDDCGSDDACKEPVKG